MSIKTVKAIQDSEWDRTITKAYGRVYSLQQQDGCKSRRTEYVTVPNSGGGFTRETVPEVVNHDTMGVSLEAWLKRDPEQLLVNEEDESDGTPWSLSLWWERNFYPSLDEVANDLFERGVLPKGEYAIIIDW